MFSSQEKNLIIAVIDVTKTYYGNANIKPLHCTPETNISQLYLNFKNEGKILTVQVLAPALPPT